MFQRNDDHPEKVKRLLGEIPRRLIIAGTVVIAVIIACLIAALVLIPHPESNEGYSIIKHILIN
ncbi:MAG: hypothetical protein K2G64_02755 [Muribaculaceae bacterium]|nr:hypothetical protein [Muribaculaceae bacterium]MDE5968003.1 hypothetical protein [Muribaculaceae bacterium]